jgi:hypothetical protein
MIRKLILPALLVCGFIRADAIFNFDSDSVGTATGFTDTVNGISATFPASPIRLPEHVRNAHRHVLGDPGPAFEDNLFLVIDFTQNLSAVCRCSQALAIFKSRCTVALWICLDAHVYPRL